VLAEIVPIPAAAGVRAGLVHRVRDNDLLEYVEASFVDELLEVAAGNVLVGLDASSSKSPCVVVGEGIGRSMSPPAEAGGDPGC
jgi:hypothetical protein